MAWPAERIWLGNRFRCLYRASLIRITETDAGTGIPYGPASRETGARNFGYFDLKRFPSLIDEVPELRDSPALFKLVQRLNRQDSIFRTLGCNRQAHRMYVHIAFEILHWNQTKTAFRRLGTDFSTWHDSSFPELCATDVEFRIGPVTYHECGLQGWAVSVHFSSSEPEVEDGEVSLQRFSKFLSFTSTRYQPQLRGCLSTLSDFTRIPTPADMSR